MTDEFPEIGLGTWGHNDPEQCVLAVEEAIEHGYRFVDTAEIYRNEEAVGEGISRAAVDRDDILLSTKLAWENLGYDDVLEKFEDCLDRLDVDYVDHLYVHRPIDTYDPEETMAAFNRLHDEGKIHGIAVSNFSAEDVEEARQHADTPIVANQVEMHPLYQQEQLREYLRSRDVELVAYSPLAHGFAPWIPELRSIAEKHDVSPAQVSIAWLTSKPNVTPIPMSDTPRFIRENFAAATLDLDESDLQTIDAIDRERKMIEPP